MILFRVVTLTAAVVAVSTGMIKELKLSGPQEHADIKYVRTILRNILHELEQKTPTEYSEEKKSYCEKTDLDLAQKLDHNSDALDGKMSIYQTKLGNYNSNKTMGCYQAVSNYGWRDFCANLRSEIAEHKKDLQYYDSVIKTITKQANLLGDWCKYPTSPVAAKRDEMKKKYEDLIEHIDFNHP